MAKNYKRESLLDRFCRYVKIDTQSKDGVEEYPSTEGQKKFLKMMFEELKALGLENVEIDEHYYVTGTLPSNIPEDHPAHNKVPTIGFLAHVDTYHEVSGKNVKPQIMHNYNGKDIVLPGDQSIVLRVDEEAELAKCKGMTIITSDGTTLLGADDKAGIAEIMEALLRFKEDPKRIHGPIRVAFTADEEVGRGTDFFDVKKFAADFAYTLDGSTAGEIEDETFCADSAFVTITGADVHPGYAKNKMVNALRAASDLIMSLPQNRTPETTEKREGYLHPLTINGNVSEIKLQFIVRDFTVVGLEDFESTLKHAASYIGRKYNAKIDVEIKESYRNMKYAMDKDARVTEYAEEAIKRSGIHPKRSYIRGGTDGARLSFQGLLTPNLFDGSLNYHSKKEWIPLEWMEKSVETVLNLTDIWVERSA